MLASAKPNNHADNHKTRNANHSVPALLSATSAFSKTVSPTDSQLNKVTSTTTIQRKDMYGSLVHFSSTKPMPRCWWTTKPRCFRQRLHYVRRWTYVRRIMPRRYHLGRPQQGLCLARYARCCWYSRIRTRTSSTNPTTNSTTRLVESFLPSRIAILNVCVCPRLAYGQQQQQRQLINKPTYGQQQQQVIPRVFNEQPRLVQSFGQQQQQLKPINFQQDNLQMKQSSGY